ncbi:histidine kinase N-terminal 7TM domain-containing protein [Halorientalis brevis]|uniref:histidine kinase n=1 Tax=Halorientalis brevis TaxID=1126241 RepID=A0ABD6C9F2_9EURY|nr:histidine kinase N-terminal 7TM domain-containing protein [Halorientalis brevis]
MPWQYTPLTTPVVVAAGAVALAAFYVVRQQRAYAPVPGGYVAVVLSIAISLTLFGYATQLAHVERAAKLNWNQLQLVWAMPVPALLLIFTLRYTGNERYLSWWSVSLAFLAPIAMIALVFTHSTHSLLWTDVTIDASGGFAALVTEPGPAMYVFAGYAYLVVGISVVLLVGRALDSAGIYRRQALLLIAGSVVPILAGSLYLTDLNPYPKLDVTIVSLAVTGLAFSWGVARHGLFTLVPIASQAAVEQMDDAVIVIDVRGLVVNVNPQSTPFLTTNVEHAVGQSVEDVLRPFAVPPGPNENRTESDREVVTDPDTGRYYQRIGTPLTDDDGVLMGQLVVLQDITERYRREKRLRQQNEQLEEFASVVSHDLRNPLNVISARSQLARETGDDEHFDALDRASDRMDQLIDDLLQLARQGQTVSETTQVDLRIVAEEAWSLVEAPEASLTVEGEMAVEADRDRLQQALENLFRNATDHVGEDVSLLVEPLEDGFAVEDDGPGIPVEEQDQVFEYGHTTEDDGTGFGLAIVKEIVEAHGWDVRVMNGDMARSSRDGEGIEYGGARFEITGVTTARSFSFGTDDSPFGSGESEFELGDQGFEFG